MIYYTLRSLFSCLHNNSLDTLYFVFFTFSTLFYIFAWLSCLAVFSIIVVLFDGNSRSVLGCYCFFIIVIFSFLQWPKIVKIKKFKYVYNHRPQLINKLTHFTHQKAIIGNFRRRSSRAGLKASFIVVKFFIFFFFIFMIMRDCNIWDAWEIRMEFSQSLLDTTPHCLL